MRGVSTSILSLLIVLMAAGVARGQPAITPRSGRAVPATLPASGPAPITVSGLSGITYAGGGTFWAVMDHSPHLVQLRLGFDRDGNVTRLRAAAGPRVAARLDAEGVAHAGPDRHSVWIADEAGAAVAAYDLNSGARLDALSIPAIFARRQRGNLGFESLALSPDGSALWTANEEALTGDGPRATPAAGTRVRLLRFGRDGAGGDAGYVADRQFVYHVDPIHGAAARGSRSGLSALVALSGGRLLALERSLSSLGFQSRIYEVDVRDATDVSDVDSIERARYTPATKRLLWKGRAAGWTGQNLEGLCLGPPLAGGGWALVGVIDNGDALLSTNGVVTFELRDPALPPTSLIISRPSRRWWFLERWNR